jgi:hypothetical protein
MRNIALFRCLRPYPVLLDMRLTVNARPDSAAPDGRSVLIVANGYPLPEGNEFASSLFA